MIEERLLVILRSRAGPRGVASVHEDILAKGAEASKEEVGAGLERLGRAGLLQILTPAPFLVLKVRSWSGSGRKPANSRPSAYSYSSSINRLNESYRQPGQTLLREILDTLGEIDPTSFEGAVRNFSPEVIRKALDRVRRARSFRKNRTALFRYLLTKLS